MRITIVTRLWPNRLEPSNASFNRQQFQALRAHAEVTVVAAIPHLPVASLLGYPRRAARLAALPTHDLVGDIPTTAMRQYYIPKVGLTPGVPLFAASLWPHRRLLAEADVVLASWAYPDACATVLVAHALGVPCCVKVHGSDINVVGRRQPAASVLRRVLPRAEGVVSVSRPLATAVREMGVSDERLHVVPNGVDKAIFRPRDRYEERRLLKLQPDGQMLLFVGRLEEAKGLRELMEAFDVVRSARPDVQLTLIGKGHMQEEVRQWAGSRSPAVRVLTEANHADIARWLGACDVFVLPSWREGTPNVILEALASARPVVATRVGGVPDVLTDRSGILVDPHHSAQLADGLVRALDRTWNAEAILAAAPCSWEESASLLYAALSAARQRF